MNNYIVSLIDSILGCNLKYNYQLHTYTTIIPNIAEKIFISKEKYIKCLLFLGIYANYNKDMAKKNFLILPYNKIDFNDFVHICPDRKIQEIFDFILDMETTHTQEGQYRVGRDDREWKEVTFILPDKNLTDTNKDKLITDINKILKIKLEYVTTDKIYLPNKENYKEIFYYREIYDAEYVSGMACSSYDINSIELKKNSFFKLLDNFVRHYLYAKRKWCYHTHSWSRSISWNDNKKYKYDLHFD